MNLILILADDFGARDLSCYGNKFFSTPNIDRLASEGARFTNAYAACPVCSPTRASILTGRYPVKTVEETLTSLGFNLLVRPEELSPEHFLALTKRLN